MKTIIIACGSGIATSTIISSKVEALLESHSLHCRLIQCSLNEVDSYLADADLIVSSMQIYQELPIPKVLGMSYLTGIGEAATNQQILDILEK